MNRIILLSIILSSVFACKVYEKPVFLRVENIQVLEADANNIELRANAFFMNPNVVGGILITDDILVFVNEIEVATVFSQEFKVPAKKEFSIPLTVNFPPSKIFENNKDDFFGTLLNAFINKKLDVQFKGNLKYKVAGFSSRYVIDHKQEIIIK